MEVTIAEKITVAISKFTDTMTIPHFTMIRPLLYNLFVVDTGTACMLITHYYITGRPSANKEFLYDPADQAMWCRNNLPYFSIVAKKLRQVRNKLAHNDLLTFVLFKDILMALVNFSRKTSQAACVLDLLLNQLYLICETILSGVNNVSYCPLCKSQTNNLGQTALLNYKDNIANDINEEIPIFQYRENNTIIEEIQTLQYWKNNGWKDKLKGLTIKVIDGKWMNYKGTFRSWSGTVAYVDLKDEGRKCLRLTTQIVIL